MPGIWNANWPPSSNGVPGATFNHTERVFANQIIVATQSEWPISVVAPAAPNTLNNAMTTREVVDSAETLFCAHETKSLVGKTNLVIEIASRGTGTAGSWVPRIYARNIPDAAAPDAFPAKLAMTAIVLGANTNWVYASQTIALATLGLTAAELVQILLTRNNAGEAGDTLATSIFEYYTSFQFT